MKKVFALTLLASLFICSAQAAVVLGYDSGKGCDLYRAVQADANGKVILGSNETIVSSKEVYGLSLQDMEINFESREVLVTPMINVVMGFNRPLIKAKAIIPADHKDFSFLINQLNRKINLFEKICINNDRIVYAKMFEQKTQSNK